MDDPFSNCLNDAPAIPNLIKAITRRPRKTRSEIKTQDGTVTAQLEAAGAPAMTRLSRPKRVGKRRNASAQILLTNGGATSTVSDEDKTSEPHDQDSLEAFSRQSESRSRSDSCLLRAPSNESEVVDARPHTGRAGSNSPETPTRKSRHKSSQSSPESPLKPPGLDSKIASELRKQIPKGQLKEKTGNNYIFEISTVAQPDKTIVKVGVASNEEKLRLDYIKNACKHVRMEQQHDPEHVPIAFFKRAEKLAHAELTNYQHHFDCPCGIRHTEYFDIDAGTAQKVVRRWRRFCKLDPYDEEGNLRPFWKHRLRHRQLWNVSDVELSLEERQKLWDRFISPADWEYPLYEVTVTFGKVWGWRWHVIGFGESFILAVVCFPSFWAMIWFAVVAAWVLLEMMHVSKKVPHGW
ncbi:hypothetical protein F5Y15DRAFT_224385 [Xylariaceae sp. FL0016]|nr:hypothetical protein F5Y15DRAFT_224385 [Xylariaceae sp. FL0016]